MQKAYNRKTWKNYPSDETPINEENLNKMEAGLDEVDNRIITLDTTKANKTEMSTLFTEISFDEATGVFTFTRKNGGTVEINTKLEKLAINFSYDAEKEQLVIALDDGTVQYVDMKALITQYEFTESDTIIFMVESAGQVSASIKLGAITGEMLEPNYLANVTVQAEKASASASAAATSATNAAKSEANAKASETNAASSASSSSASASAAVTSEKNAKASETNAVAYAFNAKDSAESAAASANSASTSASTATSKATAAADSASAAASSASAASSKASAAATSATNAENSAEIAASEAERATAAAERAESVTAVSIATTEIAGIVKPDGDTITVDRDGTIHTKLDASDVGLGSVPNVSTNNQTPTFTVASTRENIVSGEKLSAIFGKIMKFFTDLKTVAFSGTYNDLSNTPTIPEAIAVKGNAETSYRTGNVNLTPKNIGALPASGGTINSSDMVPLTIKNSSNIVLCRFSGASEFGSLGFNDVDNPAWMSPTTGQVKSLLHEGSKPSGTYTGNGNASRRTIDIGGKGSAIAIYNYSYGIAALITAGGGFFKQNSTVSSVSAQTCNFTDGVLTLAVSNMLNISITYNFQVL